LVSVPTVYPPSGWEVKWENSRAKPREPHRKGDGNDTIVQRDAAGANVGKTVGRTAGNYVGHNAPK